MLDSDNDDSDRKTTTVEAKAALMRRLKIITLTLVIETNREMSFLPSSLTKKKLRGQPQHVREEPSPEDQKFIFLSFDSSTNSEQAGIFLFG